MAQQANPMGIGHRELLRIQFMAASRRVKITLPSIFESYARGLVSLIQGTYFSPRNRQEQICEIPRAWRLLSFHALRGTHEACILQSKSPDLPKRLLRSAPSRCLF